MLTLVRRARRRLYHNELLFQGVNAGSAALLAFILLIFLGTEILSWQVALLLPLAAAGAGLYVARKRTPSLYAAAQLVDRRLSLADTLSTAFYYGEAKPSAAASAEFRMLQLGTAERIAGSIDPRRAVPYVLPRSVYAMAALALVASSLFALRYGLTRSLDLKPPLARILQQTFGSDERTEQAKNTRRPPRNDPSSPDENQSLLQDEDQQGDAQQNQSEDNSDPGAEPDAAQAENPDAENGAKGEETGDPLEGDAQDGPGDEQEGNNEDSKSDQAGDPKAQASKDPGKQDSNNSSENSSLLNKLKDFTQNLLSRMKQPNQSGQPSGEKNSKQGKGQQSGKQDQMAKNSQKQDGQQGEPQEGQSGDQADSQEQDGKGTGQNDAKQSSKQPGSGVGSQDGDKRIKQAEQLAAMGKISEIIGKRSANVTGEATVEVKSTSQTIRTPYAQRGAQHSQGGAEINRDEVPVALQSYVEHYFEQVRKQAPPAKK